MWMCGWSANYWCWIPITSQCLERAQNKALKKWEAVKQPPIFWGCRSVATLRILFCRYSTSYIFTQPFTALFWSAGHHLGTTTRNFCIWYSPVGHHKPGTMGTISQISSLRPRNGQKRNPLKPLRLKGFVAEAVGFEPTCPCGQLDFEGNSE